jgi:ankyrin repeat protein
MKMMNWLIGIAVMTATASLWAADGASESLQKGLFEEEANHNLDAAIKAYQSVIQQTDEQRKLGATAIFRLGECYRKLGRTNDAVAQYRRLLQEFPDQEKLVQASRQLESELAGGTANAAGLPTAGGEFNDSAEAKELQRVKGLVKDSPDLVNYRGANNMGGTLLHQAAGAGWISVAEFLLAHQADVNATDSSPPGSLSRRTPLHHAATAGHKSMVQLLVSHGADVNAVDSTGRTPLHEAASRGYKTVVEALIDAKANVNARGSFGWTPLHSAGRNGHRAVGAVLLKAKADPNARTSGYVTEFGTGYSAGVTPLIVAAIGDQAGFVELLCEAGAPVDASDEQRSTALHYAASSDAVKSLGILLRYKANPNAENRSHATPLHNAIYAKNRETVEALLAAGANPNASSDDQTKPLLRAVELGRLDVAQPLLAGGADANATNRSGMTALLQAVVNLNEPIAELLLTNKADPNLADAQGWTPLHSIVRKIQSLSAQGGEFPHALGIFKLLLAHKADVNLRNNDGQAPLNFFGVPAKGSRPADQEMIDLLKEHGAIDDLPELAASPAMIRVWRKGLATGRAVFYKDPAGRNRFTLLEAIWSFYNTQQQPGFGDSAFRPGTQQDPSYDFPDLARVVVRRLVDGKIYRPIEINLLKGPGDPAVIDCDRNIDLDFGDVIEIPEREHALGERPLGLDSKLRTQMQECATQRVKLFVKGIKTELTVEPGWKRYLWAVLNKPEALKVIVSSADFSRVKVRRPNPKTGKTEELTINLLDQRNGAKRSSEDLLLRDGDEIEVPEK